MEGSGAARVSRLVVPWDFVVRTVAQGPGLSKTIQLSTTLFGLIVAPFLALAVAILVIDIPGVVDWGDGILALVKAAGMHR